jgi:hypothetical protein
MLTLLASHKVQLPARGRAAAFCGGVMLLALIAGAGAAITGPLPAAIGLWVLLLGAACSAGIATLWSP